MKGAQRRNERRPASETNGPAIASAAERKVPGAGVEEGNALRELARNAVASLSGLIATVAIGHVAFETEKPNALLGLLLAFLLCVTFLSLGYFATRLVLLQSAFAFFLGSMIVTMVDYAPAIYPDTHRFPLAALLEVMRGQLVYVAVACALGYVGAWLRIRANKRQH
jgi:hypothetical protein